MISSFRNLPIRYLLRKSIEISLWNDHDISGSNENFFAAAHLECSLVKTSILIGDFHLAFSLLTALGNVR